MAKKLTTDDKEVLKSILEKYHPTERPKKEILYQFFIRQQKNSDEATIILIGHLLIENVIDKIIQNKCKSPKTILGDSKTYPFSVKLQIIYSMGLLPDAIFKNITRINKFRNRYAHDLDYEMDKNVMLVDAEDYTLSFMEMPLKKRESFTKAYIKFLCQIVLTDLSEHSQNIGVDLTGTSKA